MKVRTKIINLLVLMILVVSCTLTLFMFSSIKEMQNRGGFINRELDRNAENDVKQELRDLAGNIGNYVLVLEAEIDRSMLNAAKVLYEFDHLMEGNVTLDDLKRIREETGMSDLYLGDMDGVFTLSTEPEAIGISLFDIWEGYRMLATGESAYLPSDLKVKVETGEIYKFTAIPRAEGRGVLESALDASAIEDYLHRFIENNTSIRSMNLFDRDLMTLTSNSIMGIEPLYTKGSYVLQGTSEIDSFFSGDTGTKITMDRDHAHIYYPIIDGDRVRYVLFIDFDTTNFFAAQSLIDESISDLVKESTNLSVISQGTVFATLLIFTVFISFMISKLIRKLENAMEDAKVASLSKTVFLSNMSHEMRTPLSAIIGMTTLGKKADNIDGKNKAFHRIEEASTHLLGVINDILDISKIEAEKFELSYSEFIFESMLSNVHSIVNMRVTEKNQKFLTDIDSSIPKVIITDEQYLAQVITNLLSNAVKFTPEYGTILLGVKKTEETDDTCSIRFTIKDNGIGISEEQQKRLFIPFEQADGSISRRYGGTGLGLAISKRIIDMIGGNIWVESELGHGASFIFEIKVNKGTEIKGYNESETVSIPINGIFRGKKFLIAEDVDVNREIISALLEETGAEMEFAVNGKEAVEKFMADPDKYDLILMDIQMPEMDGYEATKYIRTSGLRRAEIIPILAMTANVFREDVERCLAAGMNGHLGKPIDMDEVIVQLKEYLHI